MMTTQLCPIFFLMLDGLSEPGNIGIFLRTCAMLRVMAMISLTGGCNVWNPKAVHLAMGALFTVPILEMTNGGNDEVGGALDWTLELLERRGIPNSRVFTATIVDRREGNVASGHCRLPLQDNDDANDHAVVGMDALRFCVGKFTTRCCSDSEPCCASVVVVVVRHVVVTCCLIPARSSPWGANARFEFPFLFNVPFCHVIVIVVESLLELATTT